MQAKEIDEESRTAFHLPKRVPWARAGREAGREAGRGPRDRPRTQTWVASVPSKWPIYHFRGIGKFPSFFLRFFFCSRVFTSNLLLVPSTIRGVQIGTPLLPSYIKVVACKTCGRTPSNYVFS